MNDRQRQQLVEQCEEAELTLLMYDYAREEGRQLAKEYDEAQKNGTLPEVPEELDRKCRALIDVTFAKMERKARLKRIVRSAARAAAVLFVVLGVMATTVMSVEALRIEVINLLIGVSEKYSTVIFNDMPPEKDTFENTYILNLHNIAPAGYQCVEDTFDANGYGAIRYENGNNEIIILNSVSTTSEFLVDTENAQNMKMDVQGHSVAIVEKSGYTAIWLDNNDSIVYTLYANGMNKDEFIKLVYAILIE